MVDASLPAAELSPAERDVRRFLRMGWTIVIAVFGGLVAWSVFAPFEGAILTQGQIGVESNQQAIQHLEGGIVREIFVREADQVKAGQKLLSLDATTTEAGVQALEVQFFELLGTEARLVAERDYNAKLELRDEFSALKSDPRMQSILQEQASLKSARQRSKGTQGQILRQRIEQLQTRINGMRNEIASKNSQISLLDQEIEKWETLRRKELAEEPRILALQRDRARVSGERDALQSDIAQTGVQIGEARSEIAKLEQGSLEEVLTELREVQTRIGELAEERIAALDRQRRLDIVAPRAGRVIGVRAHTVGGIITPSEPIMYIVPDNDRLVARVRVNPADIDKVGEGQKARLRFSAFSQNETPEFDGEVIKVSADAITDQQTGAIFYEAIVAIPEKALTSEKFVLVPGMPVDAQLRTGRRSVLSYLVKPLTDSVSKTFRE